LITDEYLKGTSGEAVAFMTRKRAMKKLQLSPKEFKKLCILKGVYPRVPKHKLKGRNKTYYFYKDILFLSHDPLLQKFREYRALKKKVKRARGRMEEEDARALLRSNPGYTIDHIIKERYSALLYTAVDAHYVDILPLITHWRIWMMP
jgi:pescadillo protein